MAPEWLAPARPTRASRFQNRLLAALLLLVLLSFGGTIGYMLLEGWNVLDALYMTVVTMSTGGSDAARPLSDAGRLFTIGLIVASLGLAGFAISTVAAFLVEGELYRMIQERRMDQRIAHLEDHIILCGAGRTGLYIATEFWRTGTPFVLVDLNAERLDVVRALGDVPYLLGDATQDETLNTAGIARARGLIAALGEDKDNVFIVLSARALNPALRIVARANDDANAEKLIKAGANQVVAPNMIGGLRMASVMLRPAVVTFLDEMLRIPNQTLRVDEVQIERFPALVGRTLAQAEIGPRTGMLVVALKSPGSGYRFNPPAETVLQADDILIVIGTREQIATLRDAPVL